MIANNCNYVFIASLFKNTTDRVWGYSALDIGLDLFSLILYAQSTENQIFEVECG